MGEQIIAVEFRAEEQRDRGGTHGTFQVRLAEERLQIGPASTNSSPKTVPAMTVRSRSPGGSPLRYPGGRCTPRRPTARSPNRLQRGEQCRESRDGQGEGVVAVAVESEQASQDDRQHPGRTVQPPGNRGSGRSALRRWSTGPRAPPSQARRRWCRLRFGSRPRASWPGCRSSRPGLLRGARPGARRGPGFAPPRFSVDEMSASRWRLRRLHPTMHRPRGVTSCRMRRSDSRSSALQLGLAPPYDDDHVIDGGGDRKGVGH